MYLEILTNATYSLLSNFYSILLAKRIIVISILLVFRFKRRLTYALNVRSLLSCALFLFFPHLSKWNIFWCCAKLNVNRIKIFFNLNYLYRKNLGTELYLEYSFALIQSNKIAKVLLLRRPHLLITYYNQYLKMIQFSQH